MTIFWWLQRNVHYIAFVPQKGPAMYQMVGRVSMKNWSLGILILNPSHTPHSALSLMTGSQWSHIKWQANIFPPNFFWVLVWERRGLHKWPHSCWIQIWGGVTHLFRQSPRALPTAWLLALTSVVASERGFINAEFKVIRNTIAFTSTQILNYYISLRWAELWVVFHWLIYVGNTHLQIIFTNKLSLGMTQKLLLLLRKCFLLWLLFLGMLHTKQYISHMK